MPNWKQLLLNRIGNPDAHTLTSIVAKLGDVAQTFLTMVGYQGGTSLADKLSAARALLLDNLALLSSVAGTVVDAGPAVTDFDTSLVAANNFYNGGLMVFVTGALATQPGHLVNVFLAANGNCAFAASDQWTAAPANGNAFVIIPHGGAYLKKVFTWLSTELTVARGLLIDRLSIITAGGAGELTPARAALLSNLDALVSSRAAPGAQMALTAAEETAIQSKIINDTTPFAGASVGNILLDTQIRKVQSGVKVINAGITKYLYIDSGTNGAEILSIAIEGVIGHDWTLDVYAPAADAEAATQPQSKRDSVAYLAADTKGGLLGPFGIPFDAYLDFTNNGVNDQIDQVTITYRSRGALTLTWEA